MKLENKDWSFRVFGDINYRGPCPKEDIEQIDFFSWLAFNHPDYAALAIHPKNEGKRTYQQVTRETMLGSINTGASDVIIPAGLGFVCEIKRRDHTKSRWQKGQPEFLTRASKAGAFSCVALGCQGAKEAFLNYLNTIKNRKKQNERH